MQYSNNRPHFLATVPLRRAEAKIQSKKTCTDTIVQHTYGPEGEGVCLSFKSG
jgi:hypothetical protein